MKSKLIAFFASLFIYSESYANKIEAVEIEDMNGVKTFEASGSFICEGLRKTRGLFAGVRDGKPIVGLTENEWPLSTVPDLTSYSGLFEITYLFKYTWTESSVLSNSQDYAYLSTTMLDSAPMSFSSYVRKEGAWAHSYIEQRANIHLNQFHVFDLPHNSMHLTHISGQKWDGIINTTYDYGGENGGMRTWVYPISCFRRSSVGN